MQISWEVSRSLKKGTQIAIVKRFLSVKWQWPFKGYEHRHFRRGNMPTQYWIIGCLRFTMYDKTFYEPYQLGEENGRI